MVKRHTISGNAPEVSGAPVCPARKGTLDQRGFTLIELMIVITIIGILATIAIPNYQWGVIKAREAVLRDDLYHFKSVIDQFHADRGKYPDTIEELKEKGYLRDIPKDPFTGSNSTWVPVEPPPQAVSPGADGRGGGGAGGSGGSDPGKVYDVRSGSDKISPTTNTPYREWE